MKWLLLLCLFPLAGCASVKQTEPAIGGYLHLLVGHELNQHVSSLEILQIQKVGDAEVFDKPTPDHGFLWLRPGHYVVQFKCNSKPGDDGYVMTQPSSVTLGSDSTYSFDIEDDFLGLDCKVTDTGQILGISGKVVMIN